MHAAAHATLQISETKMDISSVHYIKTILDFGNISAAGHKGGLVSVVLISNSSILCSGD